MKIVNTYIIILIIITITICNDNNIMCLSGTGRSLSICTLGYSAPRAGDCQLLNYCLCIFDSRLTTHYIHL